MRNLLWHPQSLMQYSQLTSHRGRQNDARKRSLLEALWNTGVVLPANGSLHELRALTKQIKCIGLMCSRMHSQTVSVPVVPEAVAAHRHKQSHSQQERRRFLIQYCRDSHRHHRRHRCNISQRCHGHWRAQGRELQGQTSTQVAVAVLAPSWTHFGGKWHDYRPRMLHCRTGWQGNKI